MSLLIAGMARGALLFRQSDLVRALRACKKVGVNGRVEIKKDSMTVHVAQPGDKPEGDEPPDDLDQELAAWEAKHHDQGSA
jgi:hypothetical protein